MQGRGEKKKQEADRRKRSGCREAGRRDGGARGGAARTGEGARAPFAFARYKTELALAGFGRLWLAGLAPPATSAPLAAATIELKTVSARETLCISTRVPARAVSVIRSLDSVAVAA